jgi:multidrug efflux pump subunit AcrB
MFAFIITLGIVVDDAIVAGENMFHHRQKGASWFKSAVDGTREIATPVTFSVLTNLVAFAPLFLFPGSWARCSGRFRWWSLPYLPFR